MDEADKLQCFMDITAINDVEYCRGILEAHGWNVELAVNTALGDGLQPTQSLAAAVSPPEETPEPIESVPRPVPLPPRVSGVQIPRLLNIPVAIVRLMSTAVAGVFGIGLQVLGGAIRAIFPQRVRRGLSGTVQSFASGLPTPDPVASADDFIKHFQASYGYTHPGFERLSYKDALKKAQQQFKFLVIYLHAPEHQDAPKFCRETLCSNAVTDFLSENFLTWGGDIRSADAFQLSSVLQASTYPFIAVLATINSRVSMIAADEGGNMNAERLLTLLAQVLETQGPEMVAARADEEERDANRRLRAEQDADYEASLAADQERENQRRAEEERVAREQEEIQAQSAAEAKAKADAEAHAREFEAALEKRRLEKAAALGSEPAAGPGVSVVSGIGCRIFLASSPLLPPHISYYSPSKALGHGLPPPDLKALKALRLVDLSVSFASCIFSGEELSDVSGKWVVL
ncbi:hypothetical protein CYMTET_53484 [Cymbomonas tetramitiformis]|uniref:UAS domain-containing protein n=1 Tax=Cymbomonas tetramitiformis TaxID=36881 RepID=A0AAE0BH46_9CHLO|nr:hypothetical protein CYMTET_53484 [Cymbomonas tetramitiformis]